MFETMFQFRPDNQRIKGTGGYSQKNLFCLFSYMFQPYPFSSQNGVLCFSIVDTFCFTGIYMMAVNTDIGEIRLC